MSSSKKIILGAIPAAFLLLTGCNNLNSDANPFWPGSWGHVRAGYTNADLLKDVCALNHAEIAEAKLAVQKAHSRTVRNYAKYLENEHMKNQRALHRLRHDLGIKKDMNDEYAKHMRQQNHANYEHLRSLKGAAFDREYIADNINQHRNAIATLDRDIAMSTDARVTNFLKDTRHHVEMHLHRAEMIQKEMM